MFSGAPFPEFGALLLRSDRRVLQEAPFSSSHGPFPQLGRVWPRFLATFDI